MSAPHPVPVAIGLLHTALTARLGDQVRVDLGLQPGTTESPDSLVVGLSPDDDAAAAGELTSEVGSVQHDIQIPCAAMSISGDEDDLLARLQRAYDLVDEVQAVLAELRVQDGPVTWGRVVQHAAQWLVSDPGGLGAQITFTVAVTAFRDDEEM